MALAIAGVVVIVELLAQDGPVAIFVLPCFAFLADMSRAAHEMCGMGR